ncbi:MAG: PaaI family thioesterase [Sulfitobacter sp.]
MPIPPHSAPSSGAEQLVGYEIDLTDPGGTSRVGLDIQPAHLNRNGTLHGGIHAMLLDAAAGFAASRRLADENGVIAPVVTLSLATSFVGARASGRVVATGTVTGGGYKIIYATAELRDESGAVLSTASGVFQRAKI